jgi:hypothetical protein
MLARATTRVLAKLPANGRARIQLRRKYEDVYARSLSDPVSFWDDAAKGIDWYDTTCEFGFLGKLLSLELTKTRDLKKIYIAMLYRFDDLKKLD